jgi:cyclopropane fatty-acyl-phospholipid synthase-like methyltransferase
MVPSKRVRALIYYEIKDYERECDALEEIFAKFSTEKIRSILDVGCGTGSHALILSNRDYRVTGIDISKVMVRKAEENAKKGKTKLEFFSQDMRKMRLNRKFNCAIMFEAFVHLLTQADLNDTLSSLNQHLDKGGLFIFDFWNTEGASNLARAFGEAHKIRYCTLAEVKQYLDNNGFSLLAVYDWNAEDKTELETPKKRTFQILAVAKKS